MNNIIPYLDRHLVLPILDFIDEHELESHEDVLRAKYELLKPTKMATTVNQIAEELGLPDRKDEGSIVAEYEALRERAEKVMDLISSEEVVKNLRQDKTHNVAYLAQNHGLTEADVALLYDFGQLCYASGNYAGAGDYLYHFRVLATDATRVLSASWGKLASNILAGEWTPALEEILLLKAQIEAFPPSAHAAGAGTNANVWTLQQRTALLHYSLFVFSNSPAAREPLLDALWLSPAYVNALQTASAWLLRYIAAGAVALARAKQAEQVARVAAQEREHSEPLTDFVHALYVDADFGAARTLLADAIAPSVDADFFLEPLGDELRAGARRLILGTFFRVYSVVDIAQLARLLDLPAAEAQTLATEFVRSAKIDATVDASAGTITVQAHTTAPYAHVIEKTKGLLARSHAMAAVLNEAKAQRV